MVRTWSITKRGSLVFTATVTVHALHGEGDGHDYLHVLRLREVEDDFATTVSYRVSVALQSGRGYSSGLCHLHARQETPALRRDVP